MSLARGNSLEVVSAERFRARLDGLSSQAHTSGSQADRPECCDGCVKERRSGGNYFSSPHTAVAHQERKKPTARNKRRKDAQRNIVRANTPIIVRLRDTIKASGKRNRDHNGGKEPKHYDDTESASSTDTEELGEVNGRCGHGVRSNSEGLRTKAIRASMRQKDEKNFMAFLSAVKRMHSKDSTYSSLNPLTHNLINYGVHNNNKALNTYMCSYHSSESLGSSQLLNNCNSLRFTEQTVSSLEETGGLPSFAPPTNPQTQRPLPAWPSIKSGQGADKGNINLVHNDLHSSQDDPTIHSLPKQDSLESLDNSEEALSSSASYRSSSDSLSPSPTPTSSDTDVETSAGSGPESEMSRDELQFLSYYTSDAPLTRFSGEGKRLNMGDKLVGVRIDLMDRETATGRDSSMNVPDVATPPPHYTPDEFETQSNQQLYPLHMSCPQCLLEYNNRNMARQNRGGTGRLNRRRNYGVERKWRSLEDEPSQYAFSNREYEGNDLPVYGSDEKLDSLSSVYSSMSCDSTGSSSSNQSSLSSISDASSRSKSSADTFPVRTLVGGTVEVSVKAMYESKDSESQPKQNLNGQRQRGPKHGHEAYRYKSKDRHSWWSPTEHFYGADHYSPNSYNQYGGFYPTYPSQYYGTSHHDWYNQIQPSFLWQQHLAQHKHSYVHGPIPGPNAYMNGQRWSVMLDISNNDVTLEITYHSKNVDPSWPTVIKSSCLKTEQSNENAMEDKKTGNSGFRFEFVTDMPCLPMQPLGYYSQWPYHCAPLTPFYSCQLPIGQIPRPITVPRDSPWLSSKRLLLVPAQHAKTFTASQPQIRPWIPIGSPPMNKPVAIFTVMCYNVLCDTYCTRQLYGYCPSWALSWEYRKKAILEEIHQYSADIITLQEVETEQFYSLFLPELKQHGYAGIFSPKSRHKTMSDSEKKRVDGCAIFFKSDKFDLKKEHLVEFNQLAMSNAEGSHDMINRVMTKDNIGLCAVLETKETVWEPGLSGTGSGRQPFLVATCHIHWDPEFSDVKLIQTMLFVHELKKIADENRPITQSLRPGGGVTNNTTASGSNTSGSHIPVLLCGDFNSLPNSGVIEFLNASVVSSGHDDFRALKYEESLKRLNLDAQQQTFKHDFKLASAYEPGVMPYTNYTYDFKGVIDYIFYSRESMRPLGVLGPIDPDWFRSNKVLGCPHPHIPSDHLPLLVEIEMSPQNWPGGAASSLNTISNANSAASALSPASSATSGSGSHSSISFPVSTGNSSTALAPPHLGGFRSAGGQGYGMGGTGGYGGRQGQQRR